MSCSECSRVLRGRSYGDNDSQIDCALRFSGGADGRDDSGKNVASGTYFSQPARRVGSDDELRKVCREAPAVPSAVRETSTLSPVDARVSAECVRGDSSGIAAGSVVQGETDADGRFRIDVPVLQAR